MKKRMIRRISGALALAGLLGLTACESLPARQISYGDAGTALGTSTAMSGNGLVLAVGAPMAKKGTATQVGEVRIYERESTEAKWTFTETVQSPADWSQQRFGDSLDLTYSGDLLAIGAPSTASYDGPGSAGRAYVFARNGANGEFENVSYLVPTPEKNQLFGDSIAFDKTGSVLAVGAPARTLNAR